MENHANEIRNNMEQMNNYTLCDQISNSIYDACKQSYQQCKRQPASRLTKPKKLQLKKPQSNSRSKYVFA